MPRKKKAVEETGQVGVSNSADSESISSFIPIAWGGSGTWEQKKYDPYQEDRDRFIRDLTVELVKIACAEPQRVERGSGVPRGAFMIAKKVANKLMIGADGETRYENTPADLAD